MILRRIKAHVEKENWFAVFLDFCIVVVGVFFGLQVQAWAEEKDRERQEAIYALRLHDEVTELQSVRQPLLALRERIVDNLFSARPLLYSETDRTLTEEECDSLALSAILTNPTDDIATLIELQQTGGLRSFRNENVLSAVRDFLLTRARARDVLEGSVRAVRPLVHDYPALMQIAPDKDPSDRFSGLIVCDLSAMRQDIDFMNTLSWNAAAYQEHVQSNRRVSESLEGLHQALDAFIDKPHEIGLEE
ncbi:hypothetical protein N9W89_05215 [Hellea sp.]|nr:hypothetical protein [Hellea sp.]